MSDEHSEKPDPIEDVRKGLGLLFRAAKGALEQLPTHKVEDVVLTGAREVGRAIENVTDAIDKQFFRRDEGGSSDAESTAGSPTGPEQPEAKAEPPVSGGEAPKGPRVG